MTEIERERRVVPLAAFSPAPKAYVGDSLNLERGETEAGEPIIFVSRGATRLGTLPGWLDLDPETWAAYVATVDTDDDLFGPVSAVRLIPFEVEACSCVRNLGGFYVRRCERHQQEHDAELEEARCEHGRLLSDERGCGRCDHEGSEAAREERRLIDEAQQL